MISRVADHCFWVGRYLDRAESTARLLQVTRSLAFDAEMPTAACWRPVVTVSGQFPDFVERFGDKAAGAGDVVQRYMTWAPENAVSIRNSIWGARESARSIREVLSLDIWQATNELYLWFVSEEAQRLYVNDRDEIYRQVRRATQLNLGLVRSTMLHDTPMDILWLGVLLERIGQTARILDMHHYLLDDDGSGKHQIVQTALWLSLLRTCSGFEAFMRVHKGRVAGAEAVSFLLFEERFPRSLRYCVRSAVGLMRRIWPDSSGVGRAPLARLTALDAWLAERQHDVQPSSIHDLLTHVVDEVAFACVDVRDGISGVVATPREDGAAAGEPATQAQAQAQPKDEAPRVPASPQQ
ncbi:MAG TPA: alpha-E domain-containing protein [Polyangia bacterium]|nr:alpha-E domain-containing protein [Polyangia bacterium]